MFAEVFCTRITMNPGVRRRRGGFLMRNLAERQGFEPWVQLLTVQRFSKPPP